MDDQPHRMLPQQGNTIAFPSLDGATISKHLTETMAEPSSRFQVPYREFGVSYCGWHYSSISLRMSVKTCLFLFLIILIGR